MTMLNDNNYFSTEMNKKYMSVSQYKNFSGCYAFEGCEEKALASLNGEYKMEPTIAMLIGSYVDAYFEGTLEKFKAENIEYDDKGKIVSNVFTQKGELRSQFSHANYIIERAERDRFFMAAMDGDKQVIMTGDLFGVEWKIKIDSINLENGYFTDLKVVQDISKGFWVKDMYTMGFVEYWGYITQMAVYQKIIEINTGEVLTPYIAAIDKQKEPDLVVVMIPQPRLDDALREIEGNLPRILDIKNGLIEPDRCEKCDYCKKTKVLTEAIYYDMLIEG